MCAACMIKIVLNFMTDTFYIMELIYNNAERT